MEKKEVIVVTEKERLPDFEVVQIPAVASMQEAYDRVTDRYGAELRVGSFPYGKWIVPK